MESSDWNMVTWWKNPREGESTLASVQSEGLKTLVVEANISHSLTQVLMDSSGHA